MSEIESAAPAVSEAPESPAQSAEQDILESKPGKAESSSETLAKAPEAPKEEPKKSNKKSLKLKVDGKDIIEELDLDDEEGLKKHLQMSKVANKRMSEFADLQKQVDELLNFAKSNPRGLLKELGVNEEEFAENILKEAIEQSKKSPDQIEREKLQAELQALKKDKEDLEAARKKAEMDAMVSEASKQIEDEMISALDNAKLPNSPYIVKRTADYMHLALSQGLDLSAADIIPLVQQELRGDMKSMIAAMGDEVLEEYVGRDRLGNYRKKVIQAAKQAAQTAKESPNSVKEGGNKASQTSDNKGKSKITVRDWLKS